MECLWSLLRYRQPDGYFRHQDPPVLYVHFPPDDGVPYHYLHGPGFLEEHAQVYVGS